MPRGSSNASSGACVEGVYDRHTYDAQKAKALQALAGMIFTIVNGVPEEPKKTKPSVWGVVAKQQARTARP